MSLGRLSLYFVSNAAVRAKGAGRVAGSQADSGRLPAGADAIDASRQVTRVSSDTIPRKMRYVPPGFSLSRQDHDVCALQRRQRLHR